MKKTLLSLSLITFALITKAQAPCSDLIISEYLEGSGNNKAIEIYNASTAPISLANYRILRHDNGNPSFTAVEGEMQLPTNITLGQYQTYVIALNLTDPNGVGQFAPIAPALQAKADTLLCPGCATGTGNSRVMCFNGDDALALQKNVGGVWIDVDIFACKGERPTNSGGTFSPTAGWTSLAPYESMPATYNSTAQGPYFKQYWTLDKTLKRKATVLTGVNINPAFQSFNPSVQWDSLAVNEFSFLGSHVCGCNTVGIKEITKSFAFSIFPNPSSVAINLQSNTFILKVVILNVIGQEVKSISSAKNLSGSTISISDLSKGVYTVVVFDEKNNNSVNKLIVE